jgi:hypothetical protein
VADDDRTRRRLGDETKSRIADLASGWSVESSPREPGAASPAVGPPAPPAVAAPAGASATAPDDADPPRKKQRTIPPPAPGSPERKAFEQQIVASTNDRDDTTDVLPPKPPSAARSIVASTNDRDDTTDVLPPKPPSAASSIVATTPARDDSTAPSIVATKPARDDVTEELVDTGSGRALATRASGGTPAVRTADDPRATHASSPPPPPERARSATGQQPIVGARTKGSTDQQPIVSAAQPPRSQTSTGPQSVVGGRARTGTGQQSIIPNIPMRAKSSTGQPSAVPRPRAATGQHTIIPTRSHGGTGPHSVLPTRSKGVTGQQPIVDDRERDRVLSVTGPHSILPARTKGDTGEQPIAVPRSRDASAGTSASLRANATSGAHGVVAAPAESSGTQPHSGVPSRRPGASVPPPVPLATPRTKTGSMPPPPPGSPERAAAERNSAYSTQPFGSADRKKPSSTPPASGDRSSALSTQPLGSVDRKRSGSAAPPPPPPSADRSKPTSAPPPPPTDRSKPTSAPPADRSNAVSTSPADRSNAGSTQPLDRGAQAPSPFETMRPKPASLAPAMSERSKPTSVPPPIVFPTSDSWSTTAPDDDADDPDAELDAEPAVPSGPRYPRAANDAPPVPFSTENRTFSAEPRTPAVIVDVSLAAATASATQMVPTGEFDHGDGTIRDKTNPRDAAEALLAIPHAETPVEELLEPDEDEDDEDDADHRAGQRPLHGAPDPATEKFERGDPTQDAPPSATRIEHVRSKRQTGGTLRASAALRRKRGLWGDVRYVSTAVFGVRRSKRELVELEHRQGLRQTSRRRHLVTLGRTAAVMDNFDHPSLGKSREQLASIEDERSKHAGAVAASDAELERVRRDRDNSAKQFAIAMSEADAEIAELAKKLEPVEKEASAARKRASDLRDELRRIEKQIADADASLVSTRSDKLDKAGVQADIATYRANKVAVLRDEPIIAAELDGLNPRIAAMEATRSGLEKKKADLDKAEQEDQRRTLELLEAIGAKRKVVERAAADAETARDNALFELGEQLYVDRPSILTAQLSPIDQIDLEIGEGERRSMELREILSNIDKAKLARGLAMIILAIGAAASLAYLIAAELL